MVNDLRANDDDPVHVAAKRGPDELAVVSGDVPWTYREFDARVDRCAQWLRQLECEQGDRIALAMANSPECLVALFAIFRCGMTACPMSTRIPDAALEESLKKVGARHVLVDVPRKLNGVLEAPVSDWVDREVSSEKLDSAAFAPADPALILFTSGSSGTPKAAAHGFSALVANAQASNENISVMPGDRWLLSLPLLHVGGLGIAFRCLLANGTVAIPLPDESFADSLARYKVTHLSLVATQLYRLLRDGADLSGLKAILLGGSAIPESLIRDATERGLPIYTSYGLTEMASQVTTTRPGDGIDALLTSGKPLRDDTLSISSEGEILVRGDSMFRGYLEEDVLVRPLTSDGWFATGDLGALDAHGTLRVTGRRDNLFISGGENIQPEEIEAALCAIDGIEAVTVVPRPDPEFGQRPVAFVRMAAGLPDAEAIKKELEKTLPRFKLPVEIYPWPEDLVETGIKASRAAFRDRAETL